MPDAENIAIEKLTLCSFQPCTEEQTNECRKCHRLFCVLHSNKFSPNFCQDCFRNLAAVEEKFQRVFEEYHTSTDTVEIRKETRTKYYMDGIDWPFVGVFIRNLSEEELRSWWVFHFSVMKLIEAENETRKIKYFQKLRETPSLVRSTVKTTTTRTVTKVADTPEQVRTKLRKQGVPESIIDMMIKSMTGA